MVGPRGEAPLVPPCILPSVKKGIGPESMPCDFKNLGIDESQSTRCSTKALRFVENGPHRSDEIFE